MTIYTVFFTPSNKDIDLGSEESTSIEILLNVSDKANNLLSKYCKYVSLGEKDKRSICRLLDILTYGKLMEAKDYKIVKYLKENI